MRLTKPTWSRKPPFMLSGAIVIASISMAGTAPAGIAAATHFGEVLGGVASTDGRVGTMVLQHGALGVV